MTMTNVHICGATHDPISRNRYDNYGTSPYLSLMSVEPPTDVWPTRPEPHTAHLALASGSDATEYQLVSPMPLRQKQQSRSVSRQIDGLDDAYLRPVYRLLVLSRWVAVIWKSRVLLKRKSAAFRRRVLLSVALHQWKCALRGSQRTWRLGVRSDCYRRICTLNNAWESWTKV
jgi:hypothetical protein